MARGVSREPVPYILEGDRGLRKEEQTVFHIRPRTGEDANKITNYYLPAYLEKDEKRSLDVRAANAADISTFKLLVGRVDNYCFPDEYYEEHPAVKDKAKAVKTLVGEEFLYVPEIESPDLLADVCRTLDSDSLREIISVSSNINKLEEGRKK